MAEQEDFSSLSITDRLEHKVRMARLIPLRANDVVRARV